MATNKELIIREGNIFFQDEIQFHFSLTLKLTLGREIHKFRDFQWNLACRRWEQRQLIQIPWPNQDQIQLEVYTQDDQSTQKVLGEGIIRMHTVQAYLSRQIRISLTYDGIFVGCLYCVVSDKQEDDHELSKHFLYVHKFALQFVDSIPHTFKMRVSKNDLEIYETSFHQHSKTKSLFPNLKVPVNMSDVIIIDITHRHVRIKPVKFVIDSIRRGKTSAYEVWLRDMVQNKMGELKIEYFLDNFYLDNERQMFSRRAILANKTLNPSSISIEQEKEKAKRSVIIKQLQEAEWRIKKIDVSMHKILKHLEDKQRNSVYQSLTTQETLKDKKTSLHRISKQKGKSKKAIHFQEI